MMNKLELAYDYLNGEEIDVEKAEHLYLEVYEDIRSTTTEKAEAAFQLGVIYSGMFDDDEGVVFKNVSKAKYYFRLAYIKGNKDAKLELSLLSVKDSGAMNEEIKSAIEVLISQKNLALYKKEAIAAIDNYFKKTFSNDVDKLLELYDEFSSFQSKAKETETNKTILFYKKKIALTISEILLSEINSIKDCDGAKRILFEINDDNVVGEAIGEINVRIIKFELDGFNNIDLINRIKYDINKFNRRESYELFNYFSDLLNLKIATSYSYGINQAPLDYQLAIKYFHKIRSSSVINSVDDELEKLIEAFILNGNFDLALSFVALIKNDKTRAEFKTFINNKEEAVKFYRVLEASKDGNEDSKLKLASYYLTGFGIKPDKNKAIELYKELFYSNNPKPAFDALFDILAGNELKSLLKEARERGIAFNTYQKEKYEVFFELKTNPSAIIKTAKNDYFDLFEPSSFGGMSQKYRDILAQELKRRGITKLIHFTYESNLKNIKKLGAILSRKQLARHPEISYQTTDSNRLEGELNGISISITKPNIPMLEQKIKNGQIINPYIIEIRSELLLDPNVRFIFCESNAARYDKNKGPLYKDFLRMFQNSDPITFVSKSGIVKSMTRDELWRKDNETTDIQAEILIEGMIPMKYIIGAHRYRE